MTSWSKRSCRARRGCQDPRGVGGERTCPPEDCGGIPGFDELVQAMADPAHPERDSFLEWLGEPFDPEAFDRDAVNEPLELLWKRTSLDGHRWSPIQKG